MSSIHASVRILSCGLLAWLLIGWLTGCGESRTNPFVAATPRPAIVVEVHNNNFLDVVVYSLRDGGRLRLGSVTGSCDATLKVSSAYAAPQGFRLEADPVGSPDTYVTDVIYVHPGTVVVLDVASVLSMSTWHLR